MGVSKGVEITLDKPRILRLSLFGAKRLKEVAGIDLFDSSTELDTSKMDVSAFIWAFLLHEDPQLSVEDVERMIYFDNLQDVIAKAFEALGLQMPSGSEESEEGENPPTVNSQTGQSFGQ